MTISICCFWRKIPNFLWWPLTHVELPHTDEIFSTFNICFIINLCNISILRKGISNILPFILRNIILTTCLQIIHHPITLFIIQSRQIFNEVPYCIKHLSQHSTCWCVSRDLIKQLVILHFRWPIKNSLSFSLYLVFCC